MAPYEADAQLAYLARTKYVDFVISEDSDLLVFETPRVFFKMDRNGDGHEISLADLVKKKKKKKKSRKYKIVM